MQTISDIHRKQIAKLIRDPRYWDKVHPEHAQVFADAQRAFNDAYPEPESDNQTQTGTVHVRAYTRTLDGKDIEVSAYDRTQQIAFHPPAIPKEPPSYLQEIAEGKFHREEKERVVELLRAHGDTVETEVTLVGINGGLARVDILGKTPDGFLYAIEIKTTAYDLFSPNQWMVYPLLDLDKHVFSTSPKIKSFGFQPGQPLPPMCLYGRLVGPGKLRRATIPLSADPICIPDNYAGPIWSWEH